ncbi:MAG TPA: CDP-glucose 4,6-dehydratase, partial [Chitinophagaceae bacterium]|nr:CDP-glucose 4,6-dehydratase [Chitinophagaceae bacterium]
MENLVAQQPLQAFYSGKKVFVTGHTGFKGAWLNALLQLLGATVKGYALAPSYQGGLFDIMEPLPAGNSIIADIRDKEKLAGELKQFNPDIIFHLAAQPLVRRSYALPAETFEVNVVGTANLLEAVHQLPGKCSTVVITTDKVYENKETNILYKETDRLGGYDPYSASKACTELVVTAFRQSFFPVEKLAQHQKSLASARAGNVIGGGDWSEDRIVPDIVRALSAGEDIALRNPAAVRPWQHVLEPLLGYLLLAAQLYELPNNCSPAYNFGPLPNDHLTVRKLVELAIGYWGKGKWKDVSDPGQLHEATLLQLDV